jgi:hypothetical protein
VVPNLTEEFQFVQVTNPNWLRPFQGNEGDSDGTPALAGMTCALALCVSLGGIRSPCYRCAACSSITKATTAGRS